MTEHGNPTDNPTVIHITTDEKKPDSTSSFKSTNTSPSQIIAKLAKNKQKQDQETPQITRLIDAYKTVVDTVTREHPDYLDFPPLKRFTIAKPYLEDLGVTLATGTRFSQVQNVNFDQVYSYNKPGLPNHIPLIPLNEYCRRPNILGPMGLKETQEFTDFLHRPPVDGGLRLFLGNLPSNTISKQILYRIFSQYGRVLEIKIKPGFGFVHFDREKACIDCIKGETGVPLHGKLMRLEILNEKRRLERNEVQKPKRRKILPDCMVFFTGLSPKFYTNKVTKTFKEANVFCEQQELAHGDISQVLSEVAYSGVLASCVIKEQSVDLQTFETTRDGVKLEEFKDLDALTAAQIVSTIKIKRIGVDKLTREQLEQMVDKMDAETVQFMIDLLQRKQNSLKTSPSIPAKPQISPAGQTDNFEQGFESGTNPDLRPQPPQVSQSGPGNFLTNLLDQLKGGH